ncbi:MAG: DUF4469 domain-containing protein [Tannerella sp.]|jgi:hypothetical protein|nr:DUF4469 domain-containing protein [Tannerella sp.]
MATTIKKIHEWFYYLMENTVTKETNDKIAKVKSKKTKGLEDLAERIVQTRTEYRKDTLVNIYRMMNEVKLEFLAEGEKVNDEITLLEPAITGNFYEDTNFAEDRNACVVNSRVTNVVQAMLQQVKGTFNGLNLENGGASIDSITDATTGAVNGEVTPGKTVTITGKKIRVVPEEGETEQNCITWTNLDTQQVVEQEDALAVNDPSKIILQLPALISGTYSLTVKTLFSSNAVNLKAPRYITSNIKLEVK